MSESLSEYVVRTRRTATVRPLKRDYTRLEAHKAQTLNPRTWDALLGDSTALGSHAVEGRL